MLWGWGQSSTNDNGKVRYLYGRKKPWLLTLDTSQNYLEPKPKNNPNVINRWTEKQTFEEPYNVTLLSKKNEQLPNVHNHMNRFQKRSIEWKKTDTRDYMALYDSMYRKSLSKMEVIFWHWGMWRVGLAIST